LSRRVLFVDPIGGLSGDMFLGAFIDLGLPLDILEAGLNKIGRNRFFAQKIEVVTRHHIAACKVSFPALPEAIANPAPKTLAAVKKFLADCGLPDAITAITLKAFHHLAAAEAKVHGVDIADIHFHEVGDYDTLADIVGMAVAVDWLQPEYLSLRPIPLGSGTVECAHGMLPVPVPAVMVLLEGLPTVAGGIKSELVTPTGAAIIKTLAEILIPFDISVCKLGRSGYGAGSRQYPEKPNLLRLTSGISESHSAPINNSPFALQSLVTIETVIDDMTPEKFAFLKDRLFDDGALEVVSWPVFMKKGRLGNSLMILLEPSLEEKIVRRIFDESPTLGIRRQIGERYFLEREIRSYTTSFGEIRCKTARDKSGRIINVKPEHDDLIRLAESHPISLTRLEQLIISELSPFHDQGNLDS